MENSLTILIAEDDANIALALKTIVRRALGGAAITIARDGQEALERLHAADYDLLISDWHMPRLSGPELLAAARATPRTRRLPFLMLTGHADAGDTLAQLNDAAADYIAKPFDNESLIEKIEKLLGENANRLN